MKPFMTAKHFEFIADAIKCSDLHWADKAHVADIFSTALETTNPMFKPDRFIQACGVNDGTDDSSSGC
jgi:hypothetical protein